MRVSIFTPHPPNLDLRFRTTVRSRSSHVFIGTNSSGESFPLHWAFRERIEDALATEWPVPRPDYSDQASVDGDFDNWLANFHAQRTDSGSIGGGFEEWESSILGEATEVICDYTGVSAELAEYAIRSAKVSALVSLFRRRNLPAEPDICWCNTKL